MSEQLFPNRLRVLWECCPNLSTDYLQKGAAEWLKGLITDGIISGVGSVVAFLPQLALLFFALSLLEDSGYMARAAFVTDRLLRSVGLSGRSFIPMCIGFGCTVPAVMAARTIENGRLKKVTALSVPFISCSAKIPVYMMALGVFSKGTRFRTVVLIYLLGILATVLSAFIMSRGVKRTGDFVLELPEYRIPTLKSVALHMKSRLGDFLTKAGTVLLLAGIVIWFLVSFDCRLNYIGSAAEKSILAYIGKALAPLLSPLGFGSWQAAVALMSGIIAKEMVVGTMNIVSGDPAALFLLCRCNVIRCVYAYVFTVCRNARRDSRRAALKASGDKDAGDSYRCRVGDRIF